MRLIFALGCLVLSHPSPANAQAAMLVYPRPSNHLRWDYAIKLVDLALRRAGRVPVLQATEQVMTQTRAARELELGRIDFIWAGTSAEYEQRFRPIPIPVLRGLDGYRICIIHQNRQAAFSTVTSIADLKALVIGQGLGWSDVTILEAAGFNVVTAPYDSLFGLVERQRIDCFLRGIHEAPGEVIQHKLEHQDIIVESDVMLVYPFASFFFVKKDNTALAEVLETGLKKAYDDGSFMAHFNSHPVTKTLLTDIRIERRRRFDIPNPLLTDFTRAIPDRYWHGR